MGSSLSEKSSGVGELEVGAESKICGEARQASSPPANGEGEAQPVEGAELALQCRGPTVQVDGKDHALPAEVAELVFPCQGKVKEWRVPSDFYATLRTCYPAVDVAGELRKAFAWIVANPGRRKTASGMPRFLTSWLNKCVDHAHVRSPPGRWGANPVEEKNLAATAVWLESVRQRKGGDNGKL
jgi:hypothetical protein